MMKNSVLLIIFFFIFNLGFLVAQKTPAIYVFGDSLVDVGNNNYLSLSLVKATLPHYGIDFPTKKPTGRFSNGKNAADLIGKLFSMNINNTLNVA
jgi:phospholipase/lecithinase/hemolysin